MNHPEEHGAAAWAEMEDIVDLHRFNPETDFFIGRNPYNFNEMIGYNDDRHVFLCAGTRGGKGRSIVIPNILNWRGSVVSVDPKGENASVCASRRAGGDEHCQGLGQKTYVLDPYGRAQVPDALRASCNLMDVLDANSGSLLSECDVLAEAMRVSQDGAESESWSKDAVEITGLVIAHVKTFYGVLDKDRNLLKVRDFLTSGNEMAVAHTKERNRREREAAEAEKREPRLMPKPNPYEELFKDMLDNPAQGGAIQRRAKGKLDLMQSNVRQWGSLIQNARAETNFIDDLEMRAQLSGSTHEGRSFSIRELQDDPNGVSVFICLPDNPDHPAIRWQKALLSLILDQMQRNQRPPATGRQVLMVLDEFASMGKMPKIANGMNSIAGAGVKLFIIVTQLADLKSYYDKAWTKFLAGSGLQMFFQIDDHETAQDIERLFGDTQITLFQRSANVSETQGTSESESTGTSEGETQSEAIGRSQAEGTSTSDSHTKGHSMSMSVTDTDTWSHQEGTGTSQTKGRSSGWTHSDTLSRGGQRSYTAGHSHSATRNGFFDPWVRSTNAGRNSSRSRGENWGSSHTEGRSGGFNESNTISQNSSDSVGGSHGVTQQSGTNESRTRSESTSRTQTLSKTYTTGISRQRSQNKSFGTNTSATQGFGSQETFHKRPLITIADMDRFLRRVDTRDHPAYPGFILIRMAKYDTGPFLARKCYYDQDPFFEGTFTPHYGHKFLPFSQQRLVGGQYTPEHFLPIRLPEVVRETATRIDVDLLVSTDQWFERGDPLLRWTGPVIDHNRDVLTVARKPIPAKPQKLDAPSPFVEPKLTVDARIGGPKTGRVPLLAPAPGKVIETALEPAYHEAGDVILVRLEVPIDDGHRAHLEWTFFGQIIEYLREKGAAQADIDRMVRALNAQHKARWQAHQDALAEQERITRRAKEAREKRKADQEKRKAEQEAKQSEAKAIADRAAQLQHYNSTYAPHMLITSKISRLLIFNFLLPGLLLFLFIALRQSISYAVGAFIVIQATCSVAYMKISELMSKADYNAGLIVRLRDRDNIIDDNYDGGLRRMIINSLIVAPLTYTCIAVIFSILDGFNFSRIFGMVFGPFIGGEFKSKLGTFYIILFWTSIGACGTYHYYELFRKGAIHNVNEYISALQREWS